MLLAVNPCDILLEDKGYYRYGHEFLVQYDPLSIWDTKDLSLKRCTLAEAKEMDIDNLIYHNNAYRLCLEMYDLGDFMQDVLETHIGGIKVVQSREGETKTLVGSGMDYRIYCLRDTVFGVDNKTGRGGLLFTLEDDYETFDVVYIYKVHGMHVVVLRIDTGYKYQTVSVVFDKGKILSYRGINKPLDVNVDMLYENGKYRAKMEMLGFKYY